MKQLCTCPNCGTSWFPQRKPKFQPRVSKAPSKPNSRSRMWNSMRIMRVFSAQDISGTAEASEAASRAYITALMQAGYVRVERATSFEVGDFTSYRLIKNTGPVAPRLRADSKTLLDLNLNQEVARVRA